ncbi:MAG: glycosyltransferase family 9 protein, partial [Bacteroidota bacterium]|nr:glycosyltransferase family 9 protein [Bacteroidota bacterium]
VKESHKVRIVLIGDASEKDRSICDYIEKNCNNILNLCGKLNIKELLNVLYNCEYVICNDSAILHLSEAVGKKVIALFGSTVKEFGFFPQLYDSKVFENNNLNCRPCTHIGRESCPLGHFRCMNEIQLAVSS